MSVGVMKDLRVKVDGSTRLVYTGLRGGIFFCGSEVMEYWISSGPTERFGAICFVKARAKFIYMIVVC